MAGLRELIEAIFQGWKRLWRKMQRKAKTFDAAQISASKKTKGDD